MEQFIPQPDEQNEADMAPAKKKKSGTDILLNILFVVFALIFVFCAVNIGLKLYGAKQEKDNYDGLADIAGSRVETTIDPDTSAPAEPEGPSRAERFNQLYEMNNSFVGWLSIPDTMVNYPVVYTPDNPEYYLRRDFYGKRATGGVPFMSMNSDMDGNSFIIHGHNMDNGTMFADILNYKKKDYWEEHPVIYFDTMEADGAYEVMAAFYYDATINPDPNAFNLYDYVGRLSEGQFTAFINGISRLKQYDTGVTAEYGDRLLTLSTCSYHTENGRFLVVARQRGGDPASYAQE